MKNFAYRSPKTLSEALALFAEPEVGTRAFAGGTDLLVQLRANRVSVDRLVDLKNVPELNALHFDGETGLTLGAAVPCHRVYEDPEVLQNYPGLVDAAVIVGGIQIQSRASVGGNLCNASPSGDTIPILIALQGECKIASAKGARTLPAEDFCRAPGENTLEADEILISLRLPPPEAHSGAHYLRFIPRNEMDIAVVGAGASVTLDASGEKIEKARLALAAVAPTPLFVREAGELLAGREVSEAAFEEAAKTAQGIVRPITDMRGTAEFRRHLVSVLTKRALRGAVDRARGKHVRNAIEPAAS